FLVEQWVRNNNIWDKTTEQRQGLIRQCETECMRAASAIVMDAIQNDDLNLPSHLTPQEIVFGFWALVFGSQMLTYSSPSLQALGISNPFHAIRVHCSNLLNGFGWKPLFTWEEYDQTAQRLAEELTPKFQSILSERQNRLL